MPIWVVVADVGYGDNPNFLLGLDECQIRYVCAVESPCGCRLPEEVEAVALQLPAYQGRGQTRKPHPAPPCTVKELIEARPTCLCLADGPMARRNKGDNAGTGHRQARSLGHWLASTQHQSQPSANGT
ncbi:hypothetical protein [Reticulibacter mediterranei]|uniref:hypothetical protein n=1 Tax=Reticulibacter mediterranei TaxID=2778369 RepID=UPI003570BC62